MDQAKIRGFSFLEMAIVLAVFVALSALTLPVLETSYSHSKADAGMNLVVSQLRMARQMAVDQRRTHRVSVFNAGKVLLERLEIGGNWTSVNEGWLPDGVEFKIEPAASEASPPDGLATSQAIDFGGAKLVHFLSTGSAVNASGDPVNGIIYLTSSERPEMARAVTLFGATGRVRAWKLRSEDSSVSWN